MFRNKLSPPTLVRNELLLLFHLSLRENRNEGRGNEWNSGAWVGLIASSIYIGFISSVSLSFPDAPLSRPGTLIWANSVEAGPGLPYCIVYEASSDCRAVESIFTGWKFSTSLKLSPPSLTTDSCSTQTEMRSLDWSWLRAVFDRCPYLANGAVD